MVISIRSKELRKALADIEAAERHGFFDCESVFEADVVTGTGNLRLRYSDMWERGHPSAPRLDWGRHQGVTRRYRLIDGELEPIEQPESVDAVGQR